MNVTALRRVISMPSDERRFRLRALARTQVQRAAVAVRGARWDRTDIAQVLAPELLDRRTKAYIKERDWTLVEDRLRGELQRSSHLPLQPGDAPALCGAVVDRWPNAAARIIALADRILAGRYSLLGFTDLSFGENGTIDWHLDPVNGRRPPRAFWADVPYLSPECGDHKIIWELNRHQHFHVLGRALWLTGDRRYGDAIVEQVHDWLEHNPPLVGINWASMLELGLRSLSWTYAIAYLLGETTAGTHAWRARTVARLGGVCTVQTPWLLDLLIGLHHQLAHVEANLSYYFSPNTHLLGEGLALYVAGTSLPQLRRSTRWTQTGRSVLIAEAGRQICADGGHVERSTHYHRYALDFYVLALLTAERAGDTAAADAFRAAVAKLAPFMRAVANDRGQVPLIGDDDGGALWPMPDRDSCDVRDSLSLAAAVLDSPGLAPWGRSEDVFWVAAADVLTAEGREAAGSAPGAATGPEPPTVFPQTGFAVIRTARGDHALMDTGPHGYMNAGHAHADALSLTISVRGRAFLIDTGTAVYTTDAALRDRMRSSLSHNTLTLDGRSSAVPSGPFGWQSRADARLHDRRGNGALAWVEASHDGYGPLTHRRSLVHTDGCGWLVIDEVLGEGPRRAQALWHFDPAWHVTMHGRHGLEAVDRQGARMRLCADGGRVRLSRGDTETGLGWCSPRYGVIVPTWSAEFTREIEAPAAMVTWISNPASPAGPAPVVERETVHADPEAGAIGTRVQWQDVSVVTLVRPGDRAVRESRCADCRDYHTNARLLQFACGPDGPLALAVADGSHALALRDPLVSVGSDESMLDLHLSVDGERLHLQSSRPPARLHVQGLPRTVTTAFLNGRELRLEPSTDAAITIGGGDWATGTIGDAATAETVGGLQPDVQDITPAGLAR